MGPKILASHDPSEVASNVRADPEQRFQPIEPGLDRFSRSRGIRAPVRKGRRNRTPPRQLSCIVRQLSCIVDVGAGGFVPTEPPETCQEQSPRIEVVGIDPAGTREAAVDSRFA